MLSEKCPQLLKEWDYEKNDKSPDQISSSANYKAWWICSKCGYNWQALVYSRSKNNGTGCPVCGGKIVVEGYNDIKTNYPELVKEWDYEKNDKLGIYPTRVSKSSDKKMWWICPICNYSYYAGIKNRTRGTGCPRCANEVRTSFPEQAIYYYLKKEFPDTKNRIDIIDKEVDIFVPCLNLGIEYDGSYYHNSLSSLERERKKYEQLKEANITLIRVRDKGLNLKSYADYTLNIEKKDDDKSLEEVIKKILNIINNLFGYNSDVKVNIQKDRQAIYGQYIILRKNSSLEKKCFDLLDEWDYEKNIISPSSVVPGSEKKVWWKCKKGHSYEQQIAAHVKGQRCPFCAGIIVIPGENDLESMFPELIKEWDYDKNNKKPSEYKYGSKKKVWWKCKKGHSYFASISHRTGKASRGCPYCANKKILIGYNDLKTLKPKLVEEWCYEKNDRLPESYSCGSENKVWWKCKNGHIFDASIRSRAMLGTGCRYCYYERKKISK